MRTVFTIARTSLQVYLSDRGNLLGLLAMPVILTLFLGGALSTGGPARLRIDVLDQDGSEQAGQLIEDLHAVNPALILCPIDQNADNICGLDDAESLDVERSTERVRAGDTNGLLVIPAGYGADLTAFNAVQLSYSSRSSVTASDPALQSIQAVLQQVNGAVVAARVGVGLAAALDVASGETENAFADSVYQQAQAAWVDPPVVVQYSQTVTSQSQNSGNGFGQTVPGMATFFVVFSVLGAGMFGLMKERQQGTLPRMAVMPVRRAQIIGGKILAYFTIGIIQFAVVFIVGLVVGVDFGRDPVALLVVMLAYTLCVTALGFALAPHMRNDSQVSALTTLLGMVMGALGGAWWPLDIAPQIMQVVGHFTPVAWAMDAFRQLFFFNGGLGDVLLPVAVLLAATVALFFIGIRTFKYT